MDTVPRLTPKVRRELNDFARFTSIKHALTHGVGNGPVLPGCVVERLSDWIGPFGFGPNRHNAREHVWRLPEAGFAAQFVVAWRTLEGLPGGKNGRWVGSYGLKHYVESLWTPRVYISNGALILAALAHKCDLRPTDIPNVDIWIGACDYDVMRDNVAQEIKRLAG